MPEVAKQLINPVKIIITIFWNRFGIQVLAALPEKISFNAEYMIDYVLTRIEELSAIRAAVTQKQTLVIHMDNSPIRKSKPAIQKIASLRLKIAPHPPYSPDLALSDFLIFGYIKQKIVGHEFVSADGLLEGIREAFGPFEDPSLKAYLTNG
jgi:hypothetical protein